MPITDTNTNVYDYPMSTMGINLHKNIMNLRPEECLLAQNLIWKNGMVKRGGQILVTSTEVVSSKEILGLHRFYKSNGTKQILAACDTTVKYFVGPSTWTSIGVTQTTGLQTYMATWGPLDKVYICNGTDAMKSWDGSASATITIADGVPSQALSYQDRLLTIIGGDLTWSASYDDTGANWETIANCGVRPDSILYGMAYHSVSNEAAGFDTKILLAGASGMYLFWGNRLTVPFSTGDYSIYPLAVTAGCNAPRTMVWTPKGTIWLGIDREVYLLPFNSATPIPIGTKIQSNQVFTEGIEKIPPAQLANACAVYHDGYYKLSIAELAGSYNITQWWLDIKRLHQDDDGHWGPWYGPMVGQSISCYALQSGTGDSGELLAGEAQDKGYVYYVGSRDYNGDIDISTGSAVAMQIYWNTYYHPLGIESLRKDVHMCEAGLLDVLGTVNIDFQDIEGLLSSGESFGLSGSAIYWDDVYWDEEYWSSSLPTRQKVDISPPIRPRTLSVLIKHSSLLDTFELYSLAVKATEQGQVFE